MQSSPFNGALPLPEVPLPSDTVCYTVELPNEPRLLEAFEGAIQMLSRWPYWARDDDHRGIVAANVFKDLYLTLEAGACEVVNIRLNPVDFCVLQLTTDGGIHWVDVADLSNCAHAAAVDEIGQARGRGDLSGGQSQPGIGAGDVGACYTYHVTLSGNQRWISPNSVAVGDTITVSNVEGAWWDGNILNAWDCGDGNQYLLGECGAGADPGDPSDPIPTANHMRLIGNVPTETVPFFDLFNTSYTVAQTGPSDFYMQANDSALADNQGAVSYDVEICKAGWCRVWDFLVSDGGWTPVVSSGNNPVWAAGFGWGGSGTEADRILIELTLAASVQVVSFQIIMSRPYTAPDVMQLAMRHDGTFVSAAYPYVGNGNVILPVNAMSTVLATECERGGTDQSFSGYITKIVARGLGTPPTEGDGC